MKKENIANEIDKNDEIDEFDKGSLTALYMVLQLTDQYKNLMKDPVAIPIHIVEKYCKAVAANILKEEDDEKTS